MKWQNLLLTFERSFTSLPNKMYISKIIWTALDTVLDYSYRHNLIRTK